MAAEQLSPGPYGYLTDLGGRSNPNAHAGPARLLREYLPRRELARAYASCQLPLSWIVESGGQYELVSVALVPTSGQAILARVRMAAAVLLIVEEYLWLAREPPEELAAAASMCWLDDLVRGAPGHPLRCRGERA